MQLKKILIVSSYSPPSIGGPQNLYNLMRDFSADRYCILTSYYNIDNLSSEKGLWLKGKYIFYDRPNADKSLRIKSAKNGDKSRSVNILQKVKFLTKRNILIRAIVGGPAILAQVLKIVQEGSKAITREKIDIMVGVSDYGPAMLGTYFLYKLTKKPYHLFLFDLYKGNYFPFPGGLIANMFEKNILKSAEKIIVTNDGTKEFYEKRHGKSVSEKCVVIYNSVFPEKYAEASQAQLHKETKKTPEILFTGRIYWPQIGAIKNLIEAVNEIKDPVILKIYTPNPVDYLKKMGVTESDRVKISFASPEEMPKIQSEADILFLPLSWHTKSQAIIDTATPGKLTDYLIAGKPILIHAPSSSFLVKYAKDNNFAEVVDKESVEDLKTTIKKLIDNKDYVAEITSNAKKTFFENHDANKNAKTFYNLFTK